MPRYLVDTSAWLQAFARPSRLDIKAIASTPQIVVCPVIIQELLQGTPDEFTMRRMQTHLLALAIVESPTPVERYLEAAALYRIARSKGLTIRSSVDCLIAACAIRHDLEVLHHDRDFAALARVSTLRERRV